jgi:hypothetical protein
MRVAVVRFVVAALLFAGWIGFLGYLALTKSKPVVLSRPQLLISETDVIAEVDSLDKPVLVKEVLFSQLEKSIEPGDKIQVSNLSACRRPLRKGETVLDVPGDWTGPGQYLLPLRKVKNNNPTPQYEVIVIPSSPGFGGHELPTPRIYPANDETLREYRQIKP